MQITKVRKDSRGRITEVMLDDKKTYSIEQAIQMARNNEIQGVNVGKNTQGEDILRGNPDGDRSNNLDSLPTF